MRARPCIAGQLCRQGGAGLKLFSLAGIAYSDIVACAGLPIGCAATCIAHQCLVAVWSCIGWAVLISCAVFTQLLCVLLIALAATASAQPFAPGTGFLPTGKSACSAACSRAMSGRRPARMVPFFHRASPTLPWQSYNGWRHDGLLGD